MILVDAAAWINAAFWTVRFALGVQAARRTRALAAVAPLAGEALPRLAVLVPALNEGEAVRAALESLVAQDYPDLLVIPIDDRSADVTGRIMDEVAAKYPRVQPIHIERLPDGWLGKNHANWAGYRRARELGAEWLLFTDGDVQFAPQALRRAMAYEESAGLDHLAITPGLIHGGFLESLFVVSFIVWFTTRYMPWLAEDPRSGRFIGIGAFNLVRREAYEAIGTHEALALTVADDMALGKLVKAAGYRQGFLEGNGEVRVRWQTGFVAALRGISKNTFPALDFSWAKTLGPCAALLLLNVVVFVLPVFARGAAGAAAWVGLAGVVTVFTWVALRLRHSWPMAIALGLFAWVGGLFFIVAMLASAVTIQRRGGVDWRGTFYSIDDLRGRQVRLDPIRRPAGTGRGRGRRME